MGTARLKVEGATRYMRNPPCAPPISNIGRRAYGLQTDDVKLTSRYGVSVPLTLSLGLPNSVRPQPSLEMPRCELS